MIEKRTWKEFQDTKLLWWVNRTLHLFGWTIVLSISKDGSDCEAFPARVSYRGFSRENEEKGFTILTKYLATNAAGLEKELENEA